MPGLVCAFICVLASALLRVVLRQLANSGARPLNTLVIYQNGAFLVMLLIFGIPNLSGVTAPLACLLLLHGALWTLAMWCEVKASESLDASSGEVFGTFGFILSVTAGVLFFGERLSWLGCLGAFLVVGSVAFGHSLLHSTFKGSLLRTGGALIAATANIVSKYMTSELPTEIIVMSGVLVPGLTYAFLNRRGLKAIPRIIRATRYKILVIPLLEAVSFTAWVKALSLEGIIISTTVFQTSIAMIFLLELLMPSYRRDAAKRALPCGLAMLGAILVVAA